MLTRNLAIIRYEGKLAVPDRLTRRRHEHYMGLAEGMLAVYRGGMGQMRECLHREVRSVFASQEDCPGRRIDAFCKLLDESAEYEHVSSSRAAELRIRVFKAAALLHPLVNEADPWFEHEERSAKEKVAAQVQMTWLELESQLFADLMQYHRLQSFDTEVTATDMLARYNVAQVQACLFDAVKMSITARADFKQLLRYAKLAGLMHRINRVDEGYEIELDGPVSVLQSTHRYGVAMAKFLPGLLACSDWKMKALLKVARWNRHAVLELNSNCGLSSTAAPAARFDSTVEEKFSEKWGTEAREGWTLERESEVLHQGQKVFVPDFTFVHTSGRRVSMEIVGFWTPEYLHDKLITLATFRDQQLILAVQEAHVEQFGEHARRMVTYKSVLKIDAVLSLLRQAVAA